MTGDRAFSVRFDDLQDGVGLVLADPVSLLVATDPAEVVPVLTEVEAATQRGWWAAGYIGYEAAAGLPEALPVRRAVRGTTFADLPLVWFGLFATCRRDAVVVGPARGSELTPLIWRLDDDDMSYAQKVRTVRRFIAAGETYQTNLTTRARTVVSGDPMDLYAPLALAQRGRYAACLDTGRFVIASASPELFFDWRGERLTTRPMKGTARRGRCPTEDAKRAAALSGSAKERAENVMIVDLLRNDLGRLARPGSVEVPDLCVRERYETVWQLTSTVTAGVRPGTRLVDVFSALFPCGSVTGAPKGRTMQIIADLEGSARGVYCGAIGVVPPAGGRSHARFSVAIRTVVADRDSNDAVYGTGGGVTWDSAPAAEYDELVAKMAILGACSPT